MNVFCFTGNLGKDAELRRTQNGTPVLSFPVPVKSGYGDREKTTWVDCSLWGKRAEGGISSYLKKGQGVAVSGELTLDKYQKNDGTEGYSLKVDVGDVTLTGKKSSGGSDGAVHGETGGNESGSDSIPF